MGLCFAIVVILFAIQTTEVSCSSYVHDSSNNSFSIVTELCISDKTGVIPSCEGNNSLSTGIIDYTRDE